MGGPRGSEPGAQPGPLQHRYSHGQKMDGKQPVELQSRTRVSFPPWIGILEIVVWVLRLHMCPATRAMLAMRQQTDLQETELGETIIDSLPIKKMDLHSSNSLITSGFILAF